MDLQPPAQDWDVVWDYTMGLPEDNGFEKVIELRPRIEMTESGLRIQPTNGYVRYAPNGYETCNEGILEETIIYNAFYFVNGNRMMLSDGTSGLQIFVLGTSDNGQINFNNGMTNSQIKIAGIVANREYIIRIERIDGINRIYLNGEKIYETEFVSGYFTAGNRIFFQGGGDYLLKSIKFKKIS